MRFPTLHIPTASDVVVLHIEDLILNGVLEPGTNLPPERKLAETLGVSRTTVRDALAALQTKGLLVQTDKGTMVHNIFDNLINKPLDSLSGVDPDDILELWVKMACSAATLAADRHTPQDLEAFKATYCSLQQAIKKAPPELQTAKIKSLMNDLALASYNFVLLQVFKILNDLIFSEKSSFRLNVETEDIVPLIGMLIEALAQRDADLASSKIEELATLLVNSEGANKTSKKISPLKVNLSKPGRNLKKLSKTINPQDTLVTLIDTRLHALEAIFEFRIILERMTTSLAANRRTKKHLTLMNTKLKLLEKNKHVASNDPATIDIEFHAAIAMASGNEAMESIAKEMIIFFRRTTRGWLIKHDLRLGGLSEIHQQHRKIFDAIKNSDPDAASLAMKDHLSYVIEMLHNFKMSDQRSEISKLRFQV